MRASDNDRERVVEVLRDHTAQGRLTFEEFEERLDRAYAAKTWDELRQLTEDLPVRVAFGDTARQGGSVERPTPSSGDRRAAVLARPQMLFPILVAAVLVGVAAADAWQALPFLLIGVFWFAGPCSRKGRAYSCGTRPGRITPPPGR